MSHFNCLTLVLVAITALSVTSAQAQRRHAETDPLSPRANLEGKHPIVKAGRDGTAVPRSDVAGMISKLSKVASQESRGACSIFSATAMMEAMLILKKGAPKSIDLSEEFLGYINARSSASDGGNSDSNFDYLVTYGQPTEATYPYVPREWEKTDSEFKEFCGKVPARMQDGCRIAHRDPRLLNATEDQLAAGELRDLAFAKARKEAAAMKARAFVGVSRNYLLSDSVAVKQVLARGLPVTLDIDFYYAAWNHRLAVEQCKTIAGKPVCLPRDMDAYDHGVVGYPERGSLDRELSDKEREGHSILVVGYDDDKVVTTKSIMADGTTKTFTYKGVYYFKNSWGTDKFGRLTAIDGVAAPGYGMITQKYAHEKGALFQLPIR